MACAFARSARLSRPGGPIRRRGVARPHGAPLRRVLPPPQARDRGRERALVRARGRVARARDRVHARPVRAQRAAPSHAASLGNHAAEPTLGAGCTRRKCPIYGVSPARHRAVAMVYSARVRAPVGEASGRCARRSRSARAGGTRGRRRARRSATRVPNVDGGHTPSDSARRRGDVRPAGPRHRVQSAALEHPMVGGGPQGQLSDASFAIARRQDRAR